MLELLIALTPISLIDSLSLLPFAIVVLAVLLSGPTPYRNAAGFLLGTVLSYFAAGVLIVFGLGELIQRITGLIAEWWSNPTAIDYILSIIVGTLLILLGYRWAVARRRKAQRKQVVASMTPGQAFVTGAGATIAGLWGALPFFAAIDQILKADLSLAEVFVALAYYNIVFIGLAGALVVIRAVVGKRADAMFDAVNGLIAVWGKRVLVTLMILLGAVMLADGIGWVLGHPIIPVG